MLLVLEVIQMLYTPYMECAEFILLVNLGKFVFFVMENKAIYLKQFKLFKNILLSDCY